MSTSPHHSPRPEVVVRLPPVPARLRPHLHPDVAAVWARNRVMRRVFVGDAVALVALGLCLVTGGWGRVGANAWATLRESGGPYAWGAVMIVVGVAIVASAPCSGTVVANVLRCGGLATLVFGLMFAHSWAVDSTANLSAGVLAVYVSVQAALRAEEYADQARTRAGLR